MLYRALFTTPPALELAPGESIFATAVANHFLHGEGRGGKLVLTEHRVAFVPHRYNMQLDTFSVPWDEIKTVCTAESMTATAIAALIGVDDRGLQNGLLVALSDGRCERFVAFNRVVLAVSLERLRSVPPGQRAETLARAREADEVTGLTVASTPAPRHLPTS